MLTSPSGRITRVVSASQKAGTSLFRFLEASFSFLLAFFFLLPSFSLWRTSERAYLGAPMAGASWVRVFIPVGIGRDLKCIGMDGVH